MQNIQLEDLAWLSQYSLRKAGGTSSRAQRIRYALVVTIEAALLHVVNL